MQYQFPYKIEAFAQILIRRITEKQTRFDETIRGQEFTSWTLAAKYALKEIGDGLNLGYERFLPIVKREQRSFWSTFYGGIGS